MTVKELKKILRGAADDTEIAISVEGEVLPRNIINIYKWDNAEECDNRKENPIILIDC
jgi:hypothetical protein